MRKIGAGVASNSIASREKSQHCFDTIMQMFVNKRFLNLARGEILPLDRFKRIICSGSIFDKISKIEEE